MQYPENVTISPMLCEVEVSYKNKTPLAERMQVRSSQDIHHYLRAVWDENKIDHVEEFFVILFNRTNHILGWAKIATGGIGMVVCDPKVIFQIAIASNASSLVLAHNHPSGGLIPSEHDLNITKRIVEVGKLLEIKVLDHIILTTENYYSFNDNGTL